MKRGFQFELHCLQTILWGLTKVFRWLFQHHRYLNVFYLLSMWNYILKKTRRLFRTILPFGFAYRRYPILNFSLSHLAHYLPLFSYPFREARFQALLHLVHLFRAIIILEFKWFFRQRLFSQRLLPLELQWAYLYIWWLQQALKEYLAYWWRFLFR